MMVSMMLALALVQDAPALTPEQTAIRRANTEMMESYYPKGALRRGEEGTVGFRMTIDTKGYPSDCNVTRSSGYQDLDDATCEVMLMYGRTKPFLDGDRKVAKNQAGEFVWILPRGVARAKVAAANNQSAKAARRATQGDPTRMICRTQGKTGSLSVRERICMTASEWANQRNASQGDMAEMQRRQAMNNN